MDYINYYNTLIKPSYAPPDFIFGVAWGIIYPLIAVSAIYLTYLIYKEKVSVKLVVLFVINMIANIIFSPIQFILKNNILASIDILIVFITLALFEALAWKNSKILFFMMLPYFLWVIFATFLQLNITWLNLPSVL